MNRKISQDSFGRTDRACLEDADGQRILSRSSTLVFLRRFLPRLLYRLNVPYDPTRLLPNMLEDKYIGLVLAISSSLAIG